MEVLGTYPAIISGLTNQSGNTRPEAFIYAGDLYMIIGLQSANIISFKWNVNLSQWDADSLFSTFETNPGVGQLPGVFYFNSNLYLICGTGSTVVNGFIWSAINGRWEANDAIKTGLPAASLNCPTTFQLGTDLYTIVGKSDGIFYGFKWNGTQWEANAAITVGTVDVGSSCRPDAFYVGDTLYLYHSNNYNYKWNGTQWVNASLGGGTPGGKPTFFQKGAVTFTIFASNTGVFSGYRLNPAAKITNITAESGENIKAKLTVNLSEALNPDDTLLAYNAPSAAGYGNALYLVPLTQVNPLKWEYQTTIPEGTIFYFNAVQIYDGSQIDTAILSTTFWILPTINPITINITDANNYKTLNSPTHNYNHGSLFYDGFIYGSARNTPTLGNADVFKIEAANYSNLLQKTIYLNKTGSLNRIYNFDQIIQCNGFLWMHQNEYLIRINPADLDYMIFSGLPVASRSEPPAADANHLFLTAGLSAMKLDVSLLIGSFASYSYDGSAPVAIPPAAIINTCLFIQHHPTESVFCHSVIADNLFLYCAQTFPASTASGYDAGLGINMCHFQKIRKSDMVTVNDVVIPKSTDDMVQAGEYLFLCPELNNLTANAAQLGYLWGLFAVNKNTFELKYLKDLIPRLANGTTASDRAGYGVFYFNEKIVVQHVAKMTTVVINILNVESWGDNSPIGYATESIYKYQLNGVNFTKACNELNLDNAGYVHTNTWDVNTLIFKFPLSLITAAVKTPNIATTLISAGSNSATLNGYIIDEGQSAITAAGFKYGTDPEALTNDLPADPFSYDFTELLSSLEPGIYYFAAYGNNTEGTFYGNTVMFSTYNAVSLLNTDTVALLQFLDSHFGCSVRCIQDAIGVADGVTGTAEDQDGNIYDTVVINQKRWMVQNLKTSKYRNGDAIPDLPIAADWQLTEAGATCAPNGQTSKI